MVTSGTTTTTLEAAPCAGLSPSTFDHVACLLDGLVADVGQATGLGTSQTPAATRLGRVMPLLDNARAGCASGKAGRARKGLGGAAHKLTKFESLLRSRKARSVPAPLKSTLIAEAESVRAEMLSLRSSLHCP